ncbi:DUF6415 family natural product biosynthesis protein [Streptomyces sp. NPDC002602]|uniref:DUF6415 family natural product biosynthesis protein n=1 Tax=Streptomyces sp. NPDC002602 TaxID=3364654 RepID=UPI00367A16DE
MTVVSRAPVPTWIDMGRDVGLALALATGRPTDPAADEVRKRLRSYIEVCADPAQRYAESLADGRARDVASRTVAYARGLLEEQGGDPAAMLQLLGKSVFYLMRYAAHAPQP